jgi:hypothetical protein
MACKTRHQHVLVLLLVSILSTPVPTVLRIQLTARWVMAVSVGKTRGRLPEPAAAGSPSCLVLEPHRLLVIGSIPVPRPHHHEPLPMPHRRINRTNTHGHPSHVHGRTHLLEHPVRLPRASHRISGQHPLVIQPHRHIPAHTRVDIVMARLQLATLCGFQLPHLLLILSRKPPYDLHRTQVGFATWQRHPQLLWAPPHANQAMQDGTKGVYCALGVGVVAMLGVREDILRQLGQLVLRSQCVQACVNMRTYHINAAC